MADYNNPISDEISKIVSDGIPEPDYLEVSYSVFDFGVYGQTSEPDIKDLVNSLSRPNYVTGESSLTRRLVTENNLALSTWALDSRCIDVTAAFYKVETPNELEGVIPEPAEPTELDASEVDSLDSKIRASIPKSNIDTFFTQLLVTGVGVVSVGLFDTFYVPKSKDVFSDYLNNKYIYFERELDGDILTLISHYWDTGYEDYEPQEYEGMKTVTHGQVEIDGMFYEFVKLDNTCYYQVHDRPVIHKMYFTQHPETFMPMGVYSLIRSEEFRHIELQVAIESRITRAIKASLLVSSNALDSETTDKLYEDQAVAVSADALTDANGGSVFHFAPSRIEEIAVYKEELQRMEDNARALTGLYKRPTNIAVGNTSATEAALAYENSTERLKGIISEFTTYIW